MKQMSEVFELPVVASDVGVWMKSKRSPGVLDKHAAHAINHADALADALQELLKLACDSGLHNRKAVEKACHTLNAYRGEK